MHSEPELPARMRIHLYLKDYRPTRKPETGMEKAVAGLAAGLAASGAQAIVLCESDEDRIIPAQDGGSGFQIRTFANAFRRPLLKLAPSLIEYARKELRPGDLVVLNAIFHPSVAKFAKLLRELGVAYVVAPHDPYHRSIFRKNGHLKWPYWYLIERPMLRRAAAVQVLDLRHGELLRRRGVYVPVIEVVNGYSDADVLPLEQLSFRSAGRTRLLYLGRLEALNKGLDLLIDAFDAVAAAADVELTLQGPDYGDLESLRKRAGALKHGDRVHFLPPDYASSPAALAAQHDVFILPSRFEGFSLAAMEAMLAARPVVISEIAGLAPHVKAAGAGMIIDATVESIRDGLLAMINRRDEWRSLGMAGREYVLEKLKWSRIGAEALPQYQALAGMRKNGKPEEKPE